MITGATPSGREEGMDPENKDRGQTHLYMRNRKWVPWAANMGSGTLPKRNLI